MVFPNWWFPIFIMPSIFIRWNSNIRKRFLFSPMYSVVYLDPHELVGICFILWIVIYYYHYFLCYTFVPDLAKSPSEYIGMSRFKARPAWSQGQHFFWHTTLPPRSEELFPAGLPSHWVPTVSSTACWLLSQCCLLGPTSSPRLCI